MDLWQDFLAAIALVLILEGILPFLSPAKLRQSLQLAAQLNDASLRFIGLTAMLLGCLLLYAVR